MDRVFLDANVLFSAAYRAGSGLARLWRLKGVELLTSAYAVEEARRNLSEASQRARLEGLLRQVRIVGEARGAGAREDVGLPAKDRPILASAVAAGASHLVTGDKRHFGRYFGRRVRGVMVLPPGDYLKGNL